MNLNWLRTGILLFELLEGSKYSVRYFGLKKFWLTPPPQCAHHPSNPIFIKQLHFLIVQAKACVVISATSISHAISNSLMPHWSMPNFHHTSCYHTAVVIQLWVTGISGFKSAVSPCSSCDIYNLFSTQQLQQKWGHWWDKTDRHSCL